MTYRLYWYNGMGGLVKVARGNKGHSHSTLKEATSHAHAVLKRTFRDRQMLIMRYGPGLYNSKIVKILEYENRQDKIKEAAMVSS